MIHPILNVADVELMDRAAPFAATGPAAEVFTARVGQIGRRIGARKLGCNVTALPPGKAAYPYHSHRQNEEMFVVLQGHGEIRIGGQIHPIGTGDVIACPAGGPETAHQIRNTGTEELRFLAVSTRLSPEICEYPDSGKFGVYAELPAGDDGRSGFFRFIGREELCLDYWAGEGGNPRGQR